MSRIDRRRFLQGAGVLASLPLLESLSGTSHAGPTDTPKRLIVVYMNQGMPMQHWNPTGTPSNYQLGDIFQEPVSTTTGQINSGGETVTLADFKDDITIMTGVDQTSAIVDNTDGANAHNLSAGHTLTGIAMDPAGKSSDGYNLSGGPSIDHVIGNAITPASVAYKVFHLGVRPDWEVCYTGAAQPISRITHPNDAIDALFGNFSNDPAENAKQRAREQRVVDATKANIAWLRSRISASDRHRLDEYLERIDEIERRVKAGIALGESCNPLSPMQLEKSPYRNEGIQQFHPYYDPDIASPALIDVAVEALACDRTRVVTLQFGDNNKWHWLKDMNDNMVQAIGSGDWHSDTVHAYWAEGTGGDPLLEDHLRRVARWEHAQVAYLLHKLKSKQEGEATLLDNTLVLYANEFGSETHKHDKMPFFVAGGCAGAIHSGRWLQYSGEPHNRLFLAMLRAFGIQDATFGGQQFCSKGPLTELLA